MDPETGSRVRKIYTAHAKDRRAVPVPPRGSARVRRSPMGVDWSPILLLVLLAGGRLRLRLEAPGRDRTADGALEPAARIFPRHREQRSG